MLLVDIVITFIIAVVAGVVTYYILKVKWPKLEQKEKRWIEQFVAKNILLGQNNKEELILFIHRQLDKPKFLIKKELKKNGIDSGSLSDRYRAEFERQYDIIIKELQKECQRTTNLVIDAMAILEGSVEK